MFWSPPWSGTITLLSTLDTPIQLLHFEQVEKVTISNIDTWDILYLNIFLFFELLVACSFFLLILQHSTVACLVSNGIFGNLSNAFPANLSLFSFISKSESSKSHSSTGSSKSNVSPASSFNLSQIDSKCLVNFLHSLWLL